jgi:hypothetical protein
VTQRIPEASATLCLRHCLLDAPERGHAGYGQAAGVLSNMIEGKMVHCLQVGEGTPATAGPNLPAGTASSRSAFSTRST